MRLLDGPNRRLRVRLGENLIFSKRLNMAAAIAVLFDLAKQSGAWISEGAGQEDLLAADTLMQRFTGDALGLKWPSPLGGDTESSKQDDLIRLLTDLRDQARKNKDFALSDQIRDRLAPWACNCVTRRMGRSGSRQGSLRHRCRVRP